MVSSTASRLLRRRVLRRDRETSESLIDASLWRVLTYWQNLAGQDINWVALFVEWLAPIVGFVIFEPGPYEAGDVPGQITDFVWDEKPLAIHAEAPQEQMFHLWDPLVDRAQAIEVQARGIPWIGRAPDPSFGRDDDGVDSKPARDPVGIRVSSFICAIVPHEQLCDHSAEARDMLALPFCVLAPRAQGADEEADLVERG